MKRDQREPEAVRERLHKSHSHEVAGSLLRPYQRVGVEFLVENRRVILADEMSLGKTAQAIHAAASLGGTWVVVCPALALRVWVDEIMKWRGEDCALLRTRRGVDLSGERFRWFLLNYDIVGGWVEELRRLHPAGVILDEAHAVKNRKATRTQHIGELCANVPYVYALTGTPLANHPSDLWSLLNILRPGSFGWFWWFARQFCDAKPTAFGWDVTGVSNAPELRRRLEGVLLRRTKAEVWKEMPPKQRQVVRLDFGGPQAAVGISDTAALNRELRTLAGLKVEAAVEQALAVLAAGQKVVVLTYMRSTAATIGSALLQQAGRFCYTVDGKMPPLQRAEWARAFNDVQEPAAFVATIDSISLAIDLSDADAVIFADLDYVPSKLLQAEDRCHRMGRTKPLIIYYLVFAGGVDERVVEIVLEKLGQQDALSLASPDGQRLRTELGGAEEGEDVLAALRERLLTEEEKVCEK